MKYKDRTWGYIEAFTPNLHMLDELRAGEGDDDKFYIEVREGNGVLVMGKVRSGFIFWDSLIERNFGVERELLKWLGCKHTRKFNDQFRKYMAKNSPNAREWLLQWKAEQLQMEFWNKGMRSPPYEQLLEEAIKFFEVKVQRQESLFNHSLNENGGERAGRNYDSLI